jgi:two-component system LytT family sensor kinase
LQKGKSLARLLYKFVLQSRLYHIAFWTVYVVFVAIAVQPGRRPAEWLLYSALILFFHGLAAYFNTYFLVNRFLYTRQIPFYVLTLGLTIVAVSFPISIIFHRLVNNRDIKNMVWSWNFFLIIILTVLFTVVLIMVLKLLKNWYQEEQAKKQLMQLNLETELKFLKSQINPHFLFNSLNNLYALTLKKADSAPEVVLRLSNILRYVLYETVEGKVPLEKEVQYLRDYIELEHIRLGNRVDIRFNTSGDLESQMIEPMLFLTFVENSFKHGAAAAIDRGWVDIGLDVTDTDIKFSIANSKAGQKANLLNGNHGGIGLENLSKRLEILYPGRHELLLSDLSDQYIVNLTLKNE